MEQRFGFAPEILRRLGEELVPHPDQGLVELVRNSYDADAKRCTIDLANAKKGGTIVVEDDGVGMSLESIIDGWLVLGRSRKRRGEKTAARRVPAGDKGLGRLAGLRLGREAVLRSRPAQELGTEYVVSIDWDRFDEARVVEDVPIEIVTTTTGEPPGTTIELNQIRHGFTRGNINRLSRALVLLKDPFEHEEGFRPILLAPGFEDLERRVAESYFDDVEYRIAAELDESGRARAEVFDAAGKPLFTAGHDDVRTKGGAGSYETSKARFELWAFNMSAANFSTRSSTITEVRAWLKVVGGVHVYQHGLRVPPYGDAGYDWLAMNLRRARSPESRPSTNTSVGRVTLDLEDELLMQKTDRSGFIETESFGELRQFCQDVLDWAASEHLRVAEQKRREARKKADADAKKSQKDSSVVREALEDLEDPKAREAFSRYEDAIAKQMDALREDVLLYRTLGTVGTTSSAFAHESVKPASRIESGVRMVREAGRRDFGDKFDAAVGGQLDAIEKAAAALGRWAQLPLTLLRRDKRRPRAVDLRAAVNDVIDLLGSFMEEAKIKLEAVAPDTEVLVFAAPAAVESILANLLVNSLRAIVKSGRRPRSIRVELSVDDDSLFATLAVADSGTGIVDIAVDQIWLPGQTSHGEGTGLGLSIVRDSVVDLGGSITLVEEGQLGGAEFLVTLPVQRS